MKFSTLTVLCFFQQFVEDDLWLNPAIFFVGLFNKHHMSERESMVSYITTIKPNIDSIIQTITFDRVIKPQQQNFGVENLIPIQLLMEAKLDVEISFPFDC